ncbi:unnamed protein product, partial [Polarella glacialis]
WQCTASACLVTSRSMEKYERLRLLGVGSCSKVYLVQDTKTGEQCVVKQIETSLSGAEREGCLREAALLKYLQHPAIVGYREVFITRSGYICLVMEFADGGDLAGYLQLQRQGGRTALPEMQVLAWLAQLISALRYLHHRNVVHRDIKAKNTFLRSSEAEVSVGRLQLGDFGISTVLDSTGSVSSAIGTPCYASPERMRREAYGASADIWSLGVLAYELCCLRRPFEGEAFRELADRILEGSYRPVDASFSQDLRTAVSRMMTPEAEGRPLAAEIEDWPLFDDFRLRVSWPTSPRAAASEGFHQAGLEADSLTFLGPRARSRPGSASQSPSFPEPDVEEQMLDDENAAWPQVSEAYAERALSPSVDVHTGKSAWGGRFGDAESRHASPGHPSRHSSPGGGRPRDSIGHALLHGARRLLGLEAGSAVRR